jgi:hypothetical protein
VHDGRPVTIEPIGQFAPLPVITDSDDRVHRRVLVNAVYTTDNRDVKNMGTGKCEIIVQDGFNRPARRPQRGDHDFGVATPSDHDYGSLICASVICVEHTFRR